MPAETIHHPARRRWAAGPRSRWAAGPRARASAVVLASLFALTACGGAAESAPTPDDSVATVERVVDGDTLDATIAGKSTRVRLLNINTPEVARDGQPGEASRTRPRPSLRTSCPREPRSTWTTTWNARTATGAPSPE